MAVIDHTHPESVRLQRWLGKNRYNGAYYYSVEIGKYFIPTIETDRNWITVSAGDEGMDHSIVFVHETLKGDLSYTKYEHLFGFGDMVYVVCIPGMVGQFSRFGKTVYLPLSVDVRYVERFRREKDRDTAFAGRDEWRQGISFPDGTDILGMCPRDELLSEMARYRTVYAECRTAIEAKILGCDVVRYHPLFKDAPDWEILDSRDAARMLQRMLDEIDG